MEDEAELQRMARMKEKDNEDDLGRSATDSSSTSLPFILDIL
jgi:hypothetical protein